MSLPPLPPFSSLPHDYVTAYRGNSVRVVSIVFTVLEVVFVALRYLAKVVGRNPFGVDDWLMLGALIVCIGMNATTLASLDIAGEGYHGIVVLETHPAEWYNWVKISVALSALYMAAITLAKLAILVFYSRIFQFGFPRFATFALMAVVVAFFIAQILVIGFQCVPLAYLWDPTIPGGHCIDMNLWLRWESLPNPIIDFFMLILPIPVIWTMQSSRRIKVGATITLLTGSIGFAAAIAKSVAFFTHIPNTEDGTWTSTLYFPWVVAEAGCYVMAASLICLRPLLNRITGRTPDGEFKQAGAPTRLPVLRSITFSDRSNRASTTHHTNIELPRITSEQGATSTHFRTGRTDNEEILVGA